MCLQCNNYVIHTWALQRRASHNGALYKSIFLYLLPVALTRLLCVLQWSEAIRRWNPSSSRSCVNRSTMNQARWSAWPAYPTSQVVDVTPRRGRLQVPRMSLRHRSAHHQLQLPNPTQSQSSQVRNINELRWRLIRWSVSTRMFVTYFLTNLLCSVFLYCNSLWLGGVVVRFESRPLCSM